MNTQGVLVPMVTPFDGDGKLDIQALEKLAQYFIGQGVSGLIPCGTTGEYYTLEPQERVQVLECVRDVGRGRVSLIAGINGMSTRECIANARQAEALGYEGLMLATPAYSLPGQGEIVAHFTDVAAATRLPIIMYNFPARVGVEIGFDAVAALSRIPNIVAIKESSGDFSRALKLIHANLPDFEVICGCDDQAVDFLFWGVRGWISGGANVFPGEQAEMVKAAHEQRWDDVRGMMSAMMPAIQNMESGDYNQKAKLGCRRHGIDVGSVRPPLRAMSESDATAFTRLLDAYSR